MPYKAHIIGLCLLLGSGSIIAAEPTELTGEKDRISYSLGHQIGSDLKQQGVEPDMEKILRGLQDGLAGSAPLMSAEEMQALLSELKQDIVSSEQQERLNAIAERRIKREMARKEGEAFLAANAKKPGVTSLPSGLQYKVLKPGKGEKPAVSDTVTVHYRGTLLNGNEFGNTTGAAPERFRVDNVIPGLEEALLLMQKGAKWEIYIPPSLGFGRRGPLEDQTIIYELELLDIQHADKDTTAGKK